MPCNKGKGYSKGHKSGSGHKNGMSYGKGKSMPSPSQAAKSKRRK